MTHYKIQQDYKGHQDTAQDTAGQIRKKTGDRIIQYKVQHDRRRVQQTQHRIQQGTALRDTSGQ
jgi:hypothetical protein